MSPLKLDAIFRINWEDTPLLARNIPLLWEITMENDHIMALPSHHLSHQTFFQGTHNTKYLKVRTKFLMFWITS